MQTSKLEYEGPIYRPPSEANSLLVQATIGCPHNQCTFCMVYKNEPEFRIRPVEEIKKDLLLAKQEGSKFIRTIFFPAGNTIFMNTDDLADVLGYTKKLFPNVERITVCGSAQYIVKKGLVDMKRLAEAGLTRIHIGLESGDDITLRRVRKGSTAEIQVKAGRLVKEAGIELSEYVILGLGGRERSKEHIVATIDVLNKINPDFIRLRTFLPKINTPILEDIGKGKFLVLSPHEVIQESYDLIAGLDVTSLIVSDHYTNYLRVEGRLPEERRRILHKINKAQKQDEGSFRGIFIGTV